MSECWLVLETSGRAGRVALARGGEVVRTTDLDAARRHVRDLAPTIAGLLSDGGLRPAELTGVMASVGPGSYTGLRVGVMSAKAFAYATGCALVAVPTFAAIAEGAPAEADPLWVIGDALQGHVYLQRYRRDAETGLPVPQDELRIAPLDDVLASAPAGTWFGGPAAGLVEGRLPAGAFAVGEAGRGPRVDAVHRVGLRTRRATREELFALEPLYLRGSSAEEKAKRAETG